MTATDSRKSKLRIYYKQYLNDFAQMSILIKKLRNNISDNKRYALMCNNLNIGGIISNINFSSLVRFILEANYHREKGM